MDVPQLRKVKTSNFSQCFIVCYLLFNAFYLQAEPPERAGISVERRWASWEHQPKLSSKTDNCSSKVLREDCCPCEGQRNMERNIQNLVNLWRALSNTNQRKELLIYTSERRSHFNFLSLFLRQHPLDIMIQAVIMSPQTFHCMAKASDVQWAARKVWKCCLIHDQITWNLRSALNEHRKKQLLWLSHPQKNTLISHSLSDTREFNSLFPDP